MLGMLPYSYDFETIPVLKALTKASRALAELRGEVKSIPNETILINSLTMQEAKDSSAIENIVTTQDDLYRATVDETFTNHAAKEVQNYANALITGFNLVRNKGLLVTNDVKKIQAVLEPSKSDFRRVPGTVIGDGSGNTVYTPPQGAQEIVELMSNLDHYINDDSMQDLDPLIKMAIIHYQFESIHPFYDGNGRTGRIINILYLILKNLLDIPVLYLSRYIIENKDDYYRLLREINEHDVWEEWIVWMLQGIEITSRSTIELVRSIKNLMDTCKQTLKEKSSIYSKELLDEIFSHPYTKIKFIEVGLGVHRNTAVNYLNELCHLNILQKIKLGRSNYYINASLWKLLINRSEV